ncbi:MAG TPA: ATP-binding protein [Gemmataceae bacterium]|jgi:signal transduction histidine kinase|nr:ATP-binding protein [Gemmataceae bacterium]
MKSIRLSLLVYFLGLLAAALGVASVLAYRTAQRTLVEKKKAAEELVKAQHKERCDEEERRLNEKLVQQAHTLARLVELETNWGRLVAIHDYKVAALLPTLPSFPNGHLLAACWVGQARHNSFAPEIFWAGFRPNRKSMSTINLRQGLVFKDDQVAEFFQIDSSWTNAPYRSPSLRNRSLPLSPNPELIQETDPSPEFKDTVLHTDRQPDTPVRCVLVQATAARVVDIRQRLPFYLIRPRVRPQGVRGREGPAPRPGAGPREGPPPGPPMDGRRLFEAPVIYIQCAAQTSPLEQAKRDLAERREKELADVEADTEASLANLRRWLLTVGCVTFLAAVLGCFLLVRLGLMPLQRLSEAVSRVSPRDFRLPLEPRRLPAELQPIVARLEEMLGQLKRAFAREKQATADISHELRTPLAALLTTIELALRKQRPAEQYREMLQECQLSAQQMNTAVERLLTLARLDAGVAVLRAQSVDAGQLAEQCASVVRPLAEARGLSLTVHNKCAPLVAFTSRADGNGGGPDGPGTAQVTTDPDKLRELLTNLLHNAVQYNRPNGSIDVTVSRTNGHLDLEVSDTGIGIAPEAREMIFERFYRADPSRGTDGLHAGLGLAIVKEYVGLMGGSIEVESKEGQGSTFRVHLPAQPPSKN